MRFRRQPALIEAHRLAVVLYRRESDARGECEMARAGNRSAFTTPIASVEGAKQACEKSLAPSSNLIRPWGMKSSNGQRALVRRRPSQITSRLRDRRRYGSAALGYGKFFRRYTVKPPANGVYNDCAALGPLGIGLGIEWRYQPKPYY